MAGPRPYIFPTVIIMSTNGDGTGTTSMNGNYSVVPQLFRVQAGAGTVLMVHEIEVVIAGTGAIDQSDFANIAGGLTNGLDLQFKSAGVVHDSFHGFRVKKNYQWTIFGTPTISNYSGVPQNLTTLINFSDFGTDLYMSGDDGDYIGFLVNDNLTTLVDMIAVCRCSINTSRGF